MIIKYLNVGALLSLSFLCLGGYSISVNAQGVPLLDAGVVNEKAVKVTKVNNSSSDVENKLNDIQGSIDLREENNE